MTDHKHYDLEDSHVLSLQESLATNHASLPSGAGHVPRQSLLPIQLYRLLARDDDAFDTRILPDCRLTCRRCAYPLDAINDYMRQL